MIRNGLPMAIGCSLNLHACTSEHRKINLYLFTSSNIPKKEKLDFISYYYEKSLDVLKYRWIMSEKNNVILEVYMLCYKMENCKTPS